jgi:hypothetical protein
MIRNTILTALATIMLTNPISCGTPKPAPAIPPGEVTGLHEDPSKAQDLITVTWPDGKTEEVRVPRGKCPLGASYPPCAEG